MSTATTTFNFASDAQGWWGEDHYNPSAPIGLTNAWDGTRGNSAGCITTQFGTFGFPVTSGWFYVGTWEDLGVPSGATVTAVSLSLDERAYAVGGGCQFGPYYLYNNPSASPGYVGNTQLATLQTTRSPSSNEATWTSRAGSSISVPSGYQASTSPIQLVLNYTVQSGTPLIAWDNIQVSVTYNITVPTFTASGGVAAAPTASGTATAALPPRTGSGGASCRPSISGTATSAPPQFHATGGVSARPGLSGSAHSLGGPVAGSGAVSIHPLASGTAMEGWVFTGTANVAIRPSVSSPANLAGAMIGGSASLCVRGSAGFGYALNCTISVPTVDVGLLSGDATLAVRGGSGTGSTSNIPLNVACVGTPSNGRFNMATRGSWGTHVNDGPRPTLFAEGWKGDATSSMPMVVANSDPWPSTGAIVRLRTFGGGNPINTPCPLSVINDIIGMPDGRIDLWVGGDGVNPDYFPSSDDLPLFLARKPEAGITLAVINKGAGGSCGLSVTGVPHPTASIPLSVEGLGAHVTGTATLAIPSATAPTGFNSDIDISVPNPVGSSDGTATLAINGWRMFT